MHRAPVLVVGFKRLDAISRVLQAVARYHDGEVFVFLDHARANRPQETQECMAVRDWVADWARGQPHAEVHLAKENVGCAAAIPAAFDWVFSRGHEAAILLEDDCLPAPDFFPFVQSMLQRFADDERVMMVSGNQFLPKDLIQTLPHSYHFSRYIHTWGWATWRRAWRHYDHQMSVLSAPFTPALLPGLFGGPAEQAFYTRQWAKQLANPADTAWDYRWLLACLSQRGLCVCPARNLIRNIGFGEGSTHTARASAYQVVPRQALPMPLQHPDQVVEWRAADHWWFSHMVSKQPLPRLRRYLKRINPGDIKDEVQ